MGELGSYLRSMCLKIEKRKIEVDECYTMVVSLLVDENNIQIMAYSQPIFIPKVVEERDWSNLLKLFWLS